MLDNNQWQSYAADTQVVVPTEGALALRSYSHLKHQQHLNLHSRDCESNALPYELFWHMLISTSRSLN